MDLQAYMISKDNDIMSYINKHYSGIPRLRGIRFMKLESPETNEYTYQDELFNSYCGEDVIFIHTRCGGCNYEDFEADKWENDNPLFLTGVDDCYDKTYRDHYFKAVIDDDYKNIINNLLKEIRND